MLKSIAVCLSLSLAALPVHAKTIHRQAYKVCAAQEEAYWNGSSAQCCDTTTHKLVKNYLNGQEETTYACCEIKDNVYEDSPDGLFATSADWTVIGATNGKCCSGYTQYASDFHGVDYILSFSIRQNGGVYYCASELTSETDKDYYESDSKFCHDTYMDQELLYKDCFCSDSGDPRNGTTCDS